MEIFQAESNIRNCLESPNWHYKDDKTGAHRAEATSSRSRQWISASSETKTHISWLLLGTRFSPSFHQNASSQYYWATSNIKSAFTGWKYSPDLKDRASNSTVTSKQDKRVTCLSIKVTSCTQKQQTLDDRRRKSDWENIGWLRELPETVDNQAQTTGRNNGGVTLLLAPAAHCPGRPAPLLQLPWTVVLLQPSLLP